MRAEVLVFDLAFAFSVESAGPADGCFTDVAGGRVTGEHDIGVLRRFDRLEAGSIAVRILVDVFVFEDDLLEEVRIADPEEVIAPIVGDDEDALAARFIDIFRIECAIDGGVDLATKLGELHGERGALGRGHRGERRFGDLRCVHGVTLEFRNTGDVGGMTGWNC